MTRDKWMHVEDFNAQYDISKNHVFVIKNQSNPTWLRERKLRGRKVPTVDVNIGYLKRVESARLRWTNEAQDLYFEAMESNTSQYAFAGILADIDGRSQASWNDWMANRLFRPRNEKFTILNTKINKRMIQFIRIVRRMK